MATNTAAQFAGDISPYIAAKTLPLVRRQLVVYQFGDPATLPKGMGTTWRFTPAAASAFGSHQRAERHFIATDFPAKPW